MSADDDVRMMLKIVIEVEQQLLANVEHVDDASIVVEQNKET